VKDLLVSILKKAAGLTPSGKAISVTSDSPDKPDHPPQTAAGSQAPEAAPLDGWDESEPLLHFGHPLVDRFLIRHSLSGCAIFGTTGSGKTSGSGAALARAYLRAGYGALVLCVKPDEAALWQQYATETGRENDLILFGNDSRWTFNFLDYEARRPGVGSGLTENLIQLFVEIASIGNGEVAGGKADDPFWDRAMRSLIRNLIDLLTLAKQPVTLPLMFEVLRSAPLELSRVTLRSWQTGTFCGRLLADAGKQTEGTAAEPDYEQVSAYWTREFPAMPDKTRGSVIELFRTMAECLMRGKMRTLFCEGKSTVIPEHTMAGKILIVDLPVKVWGEVGRYAGVLWKYCFQKAIERRTDNGNGQARPVTLWADECQFFSSKYDFLFQTTARSSRVATVYLTQSMSGLMAALGGESNGKARVEALLANLDTKIFHANSDRETNQWAADEICKVRQQFRGRSVSNSWSMDSGGTCNTSSSVNEQMEYEVQPRVFTMLKKGGAENNRLVQAVIFQTGRTWSNGRTWLFTSFMQDFNQTKARADATQQSSVLAAEKP
jgi:hypothetical protein